MTGSPLDPGSFTKKITQIFIQGMQVSAEDICIHFKWKKIKIKFIGENGTSYSFYFPREDDRNIKKTLNKFLNSNFKYDNNFIDRGYFIFKNKKIDVKIKKKKNIFGLKVFVTLEESTNLKEIDQEKDRTDRFFHGQHKNEKIEICLRKHPITIFRQSGNAIIIIAVLLFLIWLDKKIYSYDFSELKKFEKIIELGIFIITTIVIHKIFIRFFNYALDRVIITSHRILDPRHTVFLRHDVDTLDLTKVQDIFVRQEGIWRNIFQYGDIIISLSGANQTFTIQDVRRPERYMQIINHIKRDHIAQRSTSKKQRVRPVTKSSHKP